MAGSLVDTVGRLAEALPDGAIDALVKGLRRGEAPAELPRLVATPAYRAAVEGLVDAWASSPETTTDALALAIECARERQQDAERERVSIVWTGPATHAVPVRRTDQVLLELITGATERLILTSYAVYRLGGLSAALAAAATRGVRIALVIEPGQAGAGQPAWRSSLHPDVAVYKWADERRLRAEGEGVGVVHAKCAVADGQKLLVSSANLTEFALSINMEIGLLVSGGEVPVRVLAHFDALVGAGELVRVSRG